MAFQEVEMGQDEVPVYEVPKLERPVERTFYFKVQVA